MTLLEDKPSSATEPDALIEEAREAQRRRYRRWGGASLLFIGLVAGVVGFVLAGGDGDRNVKGGHHGAAATVLTRPGYGILFVAATNTAVVNGHKQGGSYEVERWSEERPPYSYWIWTSTEQETSVGNTLTAYRADWNQISVGNTFHGPVPGQVLPPLNIAVELLSGTPGRGYRLSGTSVDSPILLSRRLAEITRSPSVTVDRNATFRGSPAISITSATKRQVLYVARQTGRPLAYLTTTNVLGNKNKIVKRIHATTQFDAYQTLAPTTVRMPNLVADHPHAKVPAWDRAYWKRYWSRKSSGTAAERRQALRELRN